MQVILTIWQSVTAEYFRPFWNDMKDVVKGQTRKIRLVSTLGDCQADFHCQAFTEKNFCELPLPLFLVICGRGFVCLNIWQPSPWFTQEYLQVLCLDNKSILHHEVFPASFIWQPWNNSHLEQIIQNRHWNWIKKLPCLAVLCGTIIDLIRNGYITSLKCQNILYFILVFYMSSKW